MMVCGGLLFNNFDPISQGQFWPISSRAEAVTLTIPETILALSTGGYYEAGDGGGAEYKRVEDEPPHPGKFQSDDGAWWEIVPINVNVRCFGAKYDPLFDSTDALADAREWLAETLAELYVLGGIGGVDIAAYSYTESPNWSIPNAVITAIGRVNLLNVGAGDSVIFDAGAVVGINNNVTFRGNFIVYGDAATGHGFYVRSTHHSFIQGRVRGCGALKAALKTEFSVASTFDVVASVNEEAWHAGAVPLYGHFLSKRAANETTSFCSIVTPIVEGVKNGLYLQATLGNSIGPAGTYEGCLEFGALISKTGAIADTINGVDFEENVLADVYCLDDGVVTPFNTEGGVTFDSCSSTSTVAINFATNLTLRGGQYNTVTVEATAVGTNLDIVYDRFNDGGTLTDAGTATSIACTTRKLSNSSFLRGQYPVAGPINNNETGIFDFAIPGLRVGDQLNFSLGDHMNCLIGPAFVSSAGNAKITIFNNTGALVTFDTTIDINVTRVGIN